MLTKRKLAKLSFLKWIPLLIWVVTICYLSFSSLENVNLSQFSAADKVAHVLMYAVLVYFLSLPLNGNGNNFSIGVALTIVFSASTELIQHLWVTNRFGDPFDFLANLIGIFAAYYFLRNKIKT
jgi:hypothetical protein